MNQDESSTKILCFLIVCLNRKLNMNNNTQMQRCFFVLYPETNTCQKKFFKTSTTCSEQAIMLKHDRPVSIETAPSSEAEQIQSMEFIPFELPF